MKIETTPDKVLISEDELQALIKAHVLKETGRGVSGVVKFSASPRAAMGVSAHCELLSKAIARGEA